MAILQADTRDETEDWEATLSAKDGHPVFALIAILFAMLVIGIGNTHIDTSLGVAYVLGATVGPALVLWGIGYAVTIRHASIAWRMVTLGIVLLVAALYFIGVMGQASYVAKRDFAMIAETRIDEQGLVVLPPNADRGPASRVFVSHFTALNALVRRRQALVREVGMDRLMDAQAAGRDPALLRDCARFDRAQAESDATTTRITALATALPGKLERAGIEPVVRRQLLDGMTAGIAKAQPGVLAAGERLKAMFEEAGALCTILARRHWVARGPSYAFSDMDDLRAYDRHILAFNELVRQDQVADAEMRRSNALNRARIDAAMR